MICLAACLLAGCGGPGRSHDSSPLEIYFSNEVPKTLADQRVWYGGDWANTLYIRNTNWGGDVFELVPCMDIMAELPDPDYDRRDIGRQAISEHWHWRFNGKPVGPRPVTREPETSDTLAAAEASQEPVPPTPGADFVAQPARQKALASSACLEFSVNEEDLVYASIRGRLWLDGPSVRIEAIVTNHSRFDWFNGTAFVTLWTRHAPDFADPESRRTLIYPAAGGAPLSIWDALGVEQKPQQRQGNVFQVWTHHPELNYLPTIAQLDQGGRRRISVRTEPSISLGGNRHARLRSLSANARLDLKPGQSLRYTSVVAFEDLASEGGS
jgi:hypothetical protein